MCPDNYRLDLRSGSARASAEHPPRFPRDPRSRKRQCSSCSKRRARTGRPGDRHRLLGELTVATRNAAAKSCLLSSRHVFAPQELRHGGVAVLANAPPPKHGGQCEPEYPEIEMKALMIHVPHIHLEFPLPSQGISAFDLDPSCDARFHLMAPGLKET